MNAIPEDYDYMSGVSADPDEARRKQMDQLIDALLKKKPKWTRRRARRWIEREAERARTGE